MLCGEGGSEAGCDGGGCDGGGCGGGGASDGSGKQKENHHNHH